MREPRPHRQAVSNTQKTNCHDFVIVVPVADRPQHLSDCLASLLELRRRHPYGGHISVLVADDSREPGNIAQTRVIADELTRQGLETHYLGQAEQLALIHALPPALHTQLADVIGDNDPQAFHHKGASITRNIAYLWLNRLQRDGKKRLFWFIDSDQEFRVNIQPPSPASGRGVGGENNREAQPYAIDYFHWLDRIFSETPARILTGKVVGDPPVSPAVMAGTFLDDVVAFLSDMAGCTPEAACSFHSGPLQKTHDAAYHDMAELFGFKAKTDTYRYRCPIQGAHDHAACLADFAGRLGRFFDGEHPTRHSFYEHDDPFSSIRPARTLYTGNYVFTREGLEWFIPFAALKLRMAGPTLGRAIKAELGEKFVSANLPMLHKRTVEETGQSEFRPGIERKNYSVDLSGEFERQYFGDVMLFAVERLTAQGYPGTRLSAKTIVATVNEIDAEMHARYRAKQGQITQKIGHLHTLFSDPGLWWQKDEGLIEAQECFQRFINNMQNNFGSDSTTWQLIDSATHREARKMAIGAAIGRYPDDREAWRTALRQAWTYSY